MTTDVNYAPGALLDHLIKNLQLKNDKKLSLRFGVATTIISKIRNRQIPLSATLLIHMYEESHIGIKNYAG